MGTTAVGLVLAFAVANVMGGSYFVTSPSQVIRGAPYDFTVDVFNTNQTVSVEVQLQNKFYSDLTRKYEVETIQRQFGNFTPGNTGVLTMEINNTFWCQNCYVHVLGSGGLQFERQGPVTVHQNLVTVLIQTDKAIYKPGQLVRYRALAVYPDLQIYPGKFHVEIKDPNNNKIKVEMDVMSESGVIEGSLELSDQPPFGNWHIQVSLDETIDSSSQPFTVEDYELPRFEIKVELSPYILLSETELVGTIDAKYTFGQPVKGRVELRVGPHFNSDSCGRLPPSVETSFEIDGKADFRVPVSDIHRVARVRDGSRIQVLAFVKEAATGVRLNGTSAITFYNNAFILKFLDNTPNVFKPGLPFTAFVQVHTPDNMPPPEDESAEVSVYAYATYSVSPPEAHLYSTSHFTGTFPLPGYNVSLPANGVLPIALEIPENATSINIRVHYKGLSTTKGISKSNSKSNNYMQLFLDSKNVKPQGAASFKVQATEPLYDVTMVILSRGSIVRTEVLTGNGKTHFAFSILVTAEMAPTAHLILYYTRGLDEIIADSIAFNVDGIFSNQVSVEFSTEKAEPGEEVQVKVTADVNSQINLLAVDQSVLLLKSGNDITAKKVEDAVSNFDPSKKPSNSEFALSYSSNDIGGVFRKTGLTVLTDFIIDQPRPTRRKYHPRRPSFSRSGTPGIEDINLVVESDEDVFVSVGSKDSLKEVENIRKIFPEAWLWQNSVIGPDGQTVITTKVPDTITSWIASAFATNLESGLGVAPTTAKMTVYRPFFVSLSYPSIIKRGEIAIIQATVFNYLPPDVAVTVTMEASDFYEKARSGTDHNLDGNGQSIQVPSGEQKTVYFPIKAKKIGVAEIVVKAQSKIAADGVKRQLVIEPEGAPVTFNYPMFANLNVKKTAYRKSIAFPMPTSAVKGSARVKVKVSGDLIGPSLDNIESLLTLPTGCGEQSMVKFAPNLYVAKYLKATDQLTEHLESKVMRLLATGYQRQLTYQRYDGGFSAFGNYDESGSTWLTAFVSKTLNEAQDFIYVDPAMLVKAVDWILNRQNMDGSFSEIGRVLDPNTQGTESGHALTAYVLLSLIENRNLAPVEKCEMKKKDCFRSDRLTNATRKAVKNLESNLDSITTPFTLALVTFALGEAESARADEAFEKLTKMANTNGALAYWSDKSKEDSNMPAGRSQFKVWSPPRVQGRPIDIMTTAYALLSYVSHDRLDEGIDAMKWLNKQRNPNGGFASTQDTIVALQALSTVATKTIKPSTRIKIAVIGDKKRLRYRINNKNALQLQVQEFRRAPKKIDIKINGRGLAVTEIQYQFNVNDELSTPSFDVSTVLLDDDIDSFNLMICTKWLWDRKTGMVVQEIGIPSGFNPDLSTLGKVIGMKKSERTGNVVAIYFDEIGKTSTCYSLLMTRVGKVVQNQPSFVRTFDYYQPGDQSTVFYHPKKLKKSTVSDVCPLC